MDDLLTPVTTTYLRPKKDEEPLLTEVKSARPVELPFRPDRISSADEALDALRGQPGYDTLISVLRFLTHDRQGTNAFRLHVPTPQSAAIVQTLVTEIAPNYWALLREGSRDDSGQDDSHDLNLFTRCLRSVTGINALVSHLKALIQEAKSASKESKRPDISLHMTTFLDILAIVLNGESSVQKIWTTSTSELGTQALKKVQSQALLSILTGGKLLSVTGEAADILDRDELRKETRWVTDGLEVSKWLGRNVASWAKSGSEDAEVQFGSDLFRRAMSLGYPGKVHHHQDYCVYLTVPRLPDKSCH